MKGLAAIRKQRDAWGRQVLSVCAVAWMAVILQPCAVAGQVEHECPHCPTELTHESHHREMTTGSDCVIGSQLSVEARSLKLKLDDLPYQTPVCFGEAAYHFHLPPAASQNSLDAQAILFPSGPPLNVLNCVYLK